MLRKSLIVIAAILLMAVGAGAKDLQFAWNQTIPDPDDLSHWTLYSSEISGGPYTQVTTINYEGSGATSYTSTVPFTVGAGTDKTYYFVLTASDTDANESEYSNEASVQIDVQPPAIPVQLSIEIQVNP